MSEARTVAMPAAHDVVGRYQQDEINGFSEELLDRLVELIDPAGAETLLDAMAGDGNLTARVHGWCAARGVRFPRATLIEYSRVQHELSRAALAGMPVSPVWGDALSMTPLDGGAPLPDRSFDRVVIKSANHEIPFPRQRELYEAALRVLKPGGLFVNLGFLFDDEQERREFTEITRVKDGLVGMSSAVSNRHFMTRTELYDILGRAGFLGIGAGHAFEYRIRSEVVEREYFARLGLGSAMLDLQASQARAMTLRRRGRIRFEEDRSLMVAPGEITVARRPTWEEANRAVFQACPYEFLRRLECHRELLSFAAAHVPQGGSVLDLGSGPGLLAERLAGRVSRYRGIDLSAEFVDAGRRLMSDSPAFEFEAADVGAADFGSGWDAVTVLNLLHLPGIDPVRVLRKAYAALRDGGRIVVSGPFSPDSFRRAEPFMREQLERDRLLPECEPLLAAIAAANGRILAAEANYWSIEGMIELLREVGFRALPEARTEIYYGQGFLVVAKK